MGRANIGRRAVERTRILPGAIVKRSVLPMKCLPSAARAVTMDTRQLVNRRCPPSGRCGRHNGHKAACKPQVPAKREAGVRQHIAHAAVPATTAAPAWRMLCFNESTVVEGQTMRYCVVTPSLTKTLN